ncbi:MAG: YybH family protein [Bacteroidota bacterium]
MKQVVLLSLFFAGIIFIVGCAPQGESPDQMIAEAKALDQKFNEMYNNGDVDGIMSLYWNSPDLVSYPPGDLELRGWESVKAGFIKDFGMTPRGKIEMIESNYKVAGDVVISWGKWRYTMTEPPMEILGRYTDVKAKRDGKLVYIHDHASAPMPAPPDSVSGS